MKNIFIDGIENNYAKIYIVICTNKLPFFNVNKKWLVKRSAIENNFQKTDYPVTKYYIYAEFGWDWTKPISKQILNLESGDKLLNWIYKNKKSIAYVEVWNKIS